MVKVVVNDTNVFIDLLEVGLLNEFFDLPWEVHTTDFVMYELQREGQKEQVAHFSAKHKLHVADFTIDEMTDIYDLHDQHEGSTNVSITDCSVWYYAKNKGYTLLTGDRKLRKTAIFDGVEVRGILYVFDSLVLEQVITKSLAAEKLSLLKTINPRLPKDEVESRIREWGSELELNK